jgi:4-hydroxy-tetrahydrodipicolinate synthase
MVKCFLDGDILKARELQLKSLSLTNALFSEVNPIPVKEAVRQIGFDVGKCRLPLVDIDEVGQIKISEELHEYFNR